MQIQGGFKYEVIVAAPIRPQTGDERLAHDAAAAIAARLGCDVGSSTGSYEEIKQRIQSDSQNRMIIVRGPVQTVSGGELASNMKHLCPDQVITVGISNDLGAFDEQINLVPSYVVDTKRQRSPHIFNDSAGLETPIPFALLPSRIDPARRGDKQKFFPDLVRTNEIPPIFCCVIRNVSDEYLDQLYAIANELHDKSGARMVISTSPKTPCDLEDKIVERFSDPNRFFVYPVVQKQADKTDDRDMYPDMIAASDGCITTGTLSTTADLIGKPLFYLPVSEQDRAFCMKALTNQSAERPSPELHLRWSLLHEGAMHLFDGEALTQLGRSNPAREGYSQSWKFALEQAVSRIQTIVGDVEPAVMVMDVGLKEPALTQ